MNRKSIIIVLALVSLLAGGVFAHDSESSKHHMAIRWGQNGVMFDLTSAIVLEATGLDAPQLRESLLDGATLAELITANDGDPAETSAALGTQISQHIQSAADRRIAGLEDGISEILQHSHVNKGPWRWFRPIPRLPFGGAMNDIILEAAGMDAGELRSAWMTGASIAQLIEANDGDVAQVVDALVLKATDEINAAAAARLEMVDSVASEAMGRDFSAMFERMSKFRRRGRRGFFGAWDGFGMHSHTSEAAEVAEAAEA
ncbi:MAG: hypothetical protein OXG92_05320 [Chloroflexi bacterium]|nr:hypothetical protein [Chloroflexota bacterium]MCY3582625.1 hypothetical protein [Chloroflexota bacterium]MCY3715866.1 hypothetical protein [Chloroflexota bacterium]MDE2649861.1 hypothetical protein [Chloroflexota bacterium]MXV92738.1 hypothetical protein [Chloroflexota bacterium]